MRTANACRHTAMSHPEALHKMYQALPCYVQALVAQQMRARAQRGALSFVGPANLQARFESTCNTPSCLDCQPLAQIWESMFWCH